MTLLEVTIPGQPVGKGRPRVALRGGAARALTPAKTVRWEQGAAMVLRAAWQGTQPHDGAVAAVVTAVARRPKRLTRRKDPDGPIWRPKRPDLDNVVKATLDALQLAGVIRDDAQVVHLLARSLYAAKGAEPCVLLELHAAPVLP